MTDRKPPGASFETWVEKQIREAADRGEFDNLTGAGEPLPNVDKAGDELWWVKQKMDREGESVDALLPPSLQLRKEIERLPETVRELRSEEAVRDVVWALNLRIVDWLRTPSGPRVPVSLVDADKVVEQWRDERSSPAPRQPAEAVHADRAISDDAPPRRTRWWQRMARRHPRSR